jgi:hypothetical protein
MRGRVVDPVRSGNVGGVDIARGLTPHPSKMLLWLGIILLLLGAAGILAQH